MAVQYPRGDRGDSRVLGGGTFDLVALHWKGWMIIKTSTGKWPSIGLKEAPRSNCVPKREIRTQEKDTSLNGDSQLAAGGELHRIAGFKQI